MPKTCHHQKMRVLLSLARVAGIVHEEKFDQGEGEGEDEDGPGSNPLEWTRRVTKILK